MNKSDLEQLRIEYNTLRDYNEENIKIKIVIPFMEHCGYNEKDFDYESRTYEGKKRVDISVNIKKELKLFIEVKKRDNSLDQDSCIQLVNYINTANIEWGILTNGNDYILFNNDIKSSAQNKEILRFSLFLNPNSSISKYRNKNNLKFFSYNNLFVTETTKYFRYLTEFKNKKLIPDKSNSMSMQQYYSVIYNYLNYLSLQDFPFDPNQITNKYNFKNFLSSQKNNYNNKQVKRYKTIINKYRYITSFCELLKRRNQINDNNFKFLTEEDMVKGFNLNEKKVLSNPLTNSEINEILKAANRTRNHVRNKLIILFLFYTGINPKEMPNIEINDFNENKQTININSRIIKLPNNICTILLNYLNERKKNKYKSKYLFCGLYNGSFIQLGEGNFNRIIKDILKYTFIPTERQKIISPYFFKYSLIRSMLNNKISIAEISKYTGLTPESICDYLTEDDFKKINYNNIIKKHPYNDVLANL